MTNKQIHELRKSLIMAIWADVNLLGRVDLPTLELAKKIQTGIREKKEPKNDSKQ